ARRLVLPHALDAPALAARAALRWLRSPSAEAISIAGSTVLPERVESANGGDRRIVAGVARVKDAFDAPDEPVALAAVALAGGERFVYLGPGTDPERADRAAAEARAAFETGRTPDLLRVLTARYPARYVHGLDLDG
ncbi:MAG TPA: hypothetical protein VKE69_02135, partial [Planctomycetota bacterium]|nr:hypothetical protein [Planctomycetota bacterium]